MQFLRPNESCKMISYSLLSNNIGDLIFFQHYGAEIYSIHAVFFNIHACFSLKMIDSIPKKNSAFCLKTS